jgi:hypothetical protein
VGRQESRPIGLDGVYRLLRAGSEGDDITLRLQDPWNNLDLVVKRRAKE